MNYPNNFQKSNVVYGVNLADGPENVRQIEMQPNTTAVFIDRTSPNVVFYLKSVNEYGMTKTLAAYEAKEITDKVFNVSPSNMNDYVKKEDLKLILTETLNEILGGSKNEPISKPSDGAAITQQSNSTSLSNGKSSLKY